MIDDTALAATLQAASDRRTAKQLGRELRPLRGIRGVPTAELAKIVDATWAAGVDIDDDAAALDRLFVAAWEDGIVAIGLTAALLPDAPDAAWELGMSWLARIDDVVTADTLGWLVLGPAALATGTTSRVIALAADRARHPLVRRAAVTAGLAMLPVPLQGPAAAAVRARLGTRRVAFVAEAADEVVANLVTATLRDESPAVQKALRRLLRSWADVAPASVVAWSQTVKGGFPKLLGAEIQRAQRRAARAHLDDAEE